MLIIAWCQHRPVVLSPDVIWLIICQQFSYQVNLHPEQFRHRLVEHKGKKDLVIETDTPISEISDWESVIFSFVTEISNNTKNDIATTLIADFSTTGTDERIASAVTLMELAGPWGSGEANLFREWFPVSEERSSLRPKQARKTGHRQLFLSRRNTPEQQIGAAFSFSVSGRFVGDGRKRFKFRFI